MRVTSRILFYGYVVLLIAAGAWGTVGAPVDFVVLLGLPPDDMPPQVAADVLSQYRFLRAMELGFGLFAWVFRREIFSQRLYNILFLGVMASGVFARLVSVAVDGTPSPAMLLFLAWELVGVGFVFADTRAARRRDHTHAP